MPNNASRRRMQDQQEQQKRGSSLNGEAAALSYSPIVDSLHIVKHYANGIGHIEGREDGSWLVTYYGRSVWQGNAVTLEQARKTLRRVGGTPTL